MLHGCGFVIRFDKMELVPGVLVAPMHVMNQNTMNETGRILGKDWLTHDQSCMWGSDSLVNIRVMKGNLLTCRCGVCLKRLIRKAPRKSLKQPFRTVGMYNNALD
jgi:hypothetical protein